MKTIIGVLRYLVGYRRALFICNKEEFDKLVQWLTVQEVRDPYMDYGVLESDTEHHLALAVTLSPMNRICYYSDFVVTKQETWLRVYYPVIRVV